MNYQQFYKSAESLTSTAAGAVAGRDDMVQNGAIGYGVGGWTPTTVFPDKKLITGWPSGSWGGGRNFLYGMEGLGAYTAGSYLGNKLGNGMADVYIANPSQEFKDRAQTMGDWYSRRTKDPRQKELEQADAMQWSLYSQASDKFDKEIGDSLKSLGKKSWNGLVNGVSSVMSYPGPIRGIYNRFGTTPEKSLEKYKFQDTSADTPILDRAGDSIADDIAWLSNIGKYGKQYYADPKFRQQINDNVKAVTGAVDANRDYLLAHGTPYLAQRMWNTARNAWGGIDAAVVQPLERLLGLSPDRRHKDHTKDGLPENPIYALQEAPPPVSLEDAENRVAMIYANEPNNPISKSDRFWLPAEAIGSHVVESFKEGRKNGVWAGLKTYFSNPKKNFTIPKEVYQGTLAPLNLGDTKAVIKGTLTQPFKDLPEDTKKYIGSFVPYVAPTVDEYMAKSKPYANLMLRTGILPKENYDVFYNTWEDIKAHPEKAGEVYDSAVQTFKDKKQQYSNDPVVNDLYRILFNKR